MTRALRTPRRAVAALGLLVALVAVPTGVLGQAEGTTDPPPTAILSQDGWWNRAKGPQPQEPTNPLRPAIGGVVPAPSTVPATGLGVGALGGDPDKVAAIGLVLEAGADAFVDSLVLTLQETPDSGSNLNAESAKIAACPITGFWAGVKDGDWANRPVCDEGQSVVGERAANGTWTFDLTLMAMNWLDPTSGLDQNGILLVESVDAPMSFQVSFSDLSSGKMTTAFSATPGFGDDVAFEDFAPVDEPAFTEEFEDVPVDDSSSFELDDSATFAAPRTRTVTTPRVTTPPAAAAAPQVAGTTASVRPAAAGGDLLGSLPVAALVFLVLLVLAGALLLGLVLGPLTSPTPAVVRSGGVSRVLAARAAGQR